MVVVVVPEFIDFRVKTCRAISLAGERVDMTMRMIKLSLLQLTIMDKDSERMVSDVRIFVTQAHDSLRTHTGRLSPHHVCSG